MAFIDSVDNKLPIPNLDGFDGDIRHIKVLADGKIMAAGDFCFYGKHLVPYIARLLPGGELDSTFHSPFQIKDMKPNMWGIRNISVTDDGRILVCGNFERVGTFPAKEVALLKPNGMLDTTFVLDISGLTTDTMLSVSNAFVGTNQKIYAKADLVFPIISGQSEGKTIIFRSDLNGSRDHSFAPRRYFNEQYYNAMYQGKNDQFYLQNSSAGFWWDDINNPPPPGSLCQTLSLVKIRPDGSLDGPGPVNNSGSVYTVYNPSIDRITEMKNGSIMVASHCWSGHYKFVNWAPNGQFRDYSTNGLGYFNDYDQGISPSSILLTPDSGFVYFPNGRNPVRLDKYDSEDQNFVNPAFKGGFVADMTMADSNSFYVAGSFTHMDEKPVNRIARLKLFAPVTTAVSNTKYNSDFQVFPNPGKDYLTIRLGAEMEKGVQVKLVDTQGKEVLDSLIPPYESGKEITIPTQSLPSGLYHIQVLGGRKNLSARWLKN